MLGLGAALKVETEQAENSLPDATPDAEHEQLMAQLLEEKENQILKEAGCLDELDQQRVVVADLNARLEQMRASRDRLRQARPMLVTRSVNSC